MGTDESAPLWKPSVSSAVNQDMKPDPYFPYFLHANRLRRQRSLLTRLTLKCLVCLRLLLLGG